VPVGPGENPAPNVAAIVPMADGEASQVGQLQALIDTRGIDVVLERYALESGAAAVACRTTGIPLVYEINAPIVVEAARYRALTGLAQALAREELVLRAADAAVVVSTALRDYLTCVAPDLPVTVVPNGVDPARFPVRVPRDASGVVTVGFVGSMKPWHGVQDLVTAFAALAAQYPQCRLVLAGHGPSAEAVRAQVSAAALTDRVSLLGELPHEAVPAVHVRHRGRALPAQ
jgi:glycosyltransferase involved in cell wall biosynthesis